LKGEEDSHEGQYDSKEGPGDIWPPEMLQWCPLTQRQRAWRGLVLCPSRPLDEWQFHTPLQLVVMQPHVRFTHYQMTRILLTGGRPLADRDHERAASSEM
jgi:hypothetical protein